MFLASIIGCYYRKIPVICGGAIYKSHMTVYICFVSSCSQCAKIWYSNIVLPSDVRLLLRVNSVLHKVNRPTIWKDICKYIFLKQEKLYIMFHISLNMLKYVPWVSFGNQSVVVQIMACSLAGSSHYLIQYWTRFMMPWGVTKSQWVKKCDIFHRLYDGVTTSAKIPCIGRPVSH